MTNARKKGGPRPFVAGRIRGGNVERKCLMGGYVDVATCITRQARTPKSCAECPWSPGDGKAA